MDSYHWTGPDDRNLDPVRDKPVRLGRQPPRIVCYGCEAVGIGWKTLAEAQDDGWLVIIDYAPLGPTTTATSTRMYCTVCQAYGRPLRKTP